MTDASISAPTATNDVSSDDLGDDSAVVSVLVPDGDDGEWTRYRLTPESKLTVHGPDGQPAAVIETDPESSDE